VNVAIVGGGIVGCALAYELASRGAEVRVLDPREAGQGATQASAGVLAPYVEGHSEALLRLAVCGLDYYESFIARVSADAERPIEYRRIGTLQVACGEGEVRQLAETALRLAHADVAHTYLDREAARDLEPALSREIAAALLVPQHGYVGVSTLMAALRSASSRRGVTMTSARVQRIDSTHGVRLETTVGPVEADAVVIAAGSWSGGVMMSATPTAPVRPIRGQLLHVRCSEPPVSRVIWGTSAYLVPWQDGSVLIGATSDDVGFDESATVGGVQGLIEGATALVPALAAARFAEVRVGLRPLTSDELPLIGASSTMRSVYFATGHYRNGVLLAPLTAVLLADLMLEGREPAELVLSRPGRFGL
jgi:glycine oxidase